MSRLRRCLVGVNDAIHRSTIVSVVAKPIVLVDSRRAFGQPIFVHGAAPVDSIVGRVKAGDPIAEVADDFGVPEADVRDYLDAAVPLAA